MQTRFYKCPLLAVCGDRLALRRSPLTESTQNNDLLIVRHFPNVHVSLVRGNVRTGRTAVVNSEMLVRNKHRCKPFQKFASDARLFGSPELNSAQPQRPAKGLYRVTSWSMQSKRKGTATTTADRGRLRINIRNYTACCWVMRSRQRHDTHPRP